VTLFDSYDEPPSTTPASALPPGPTEPYVPQSTPPAKPIVDRTLSIQERFERFHAANPDVYVELVQLARQAKQHGRGKWAIGSLWEVLRWQRMMRTVDETTDLKLNDHYRSRYARLIMITEADLAEFFEIRQLRS
jgi:hypothetical protein